MMTNRGETNEPTNLSLHLSQNRNLLFFYLTLFNYPYISFLYINCNGEESNHSAVFVDGTEDVEGLPDGMVFSDVDVDQLGGEDGRIVVVVFD